ncbi:MAG TPA: SAM-dependent methyltransferase [Polyangia bacterium]
MCGTGTTSVAHLTIETVGHVRDAEVVFYQTSDPLTERWLLDQRPDAQSLSTSYAVGKARRDTYAEIVERILTPVRAGRRVCATFYGHPGIVVESGHESIRRARLEGYDARMLPGISAEACLYADLGIDPVTHGCVSREATDFVLCDQPVDATLDLVLWQVGFIGRMDYQERFGTEGFPMLVERLLEAHAPDHLATIYEAASFAVARPRIDRMALRALEPSQVTAFSTLFVPASAQVLHDPRRAARLAALCAGGIGVDH